MPDPENSSQLEAIFQNKHYAPWRISFRSWLTIFYNTISDLISGTTSLVAAGCAFFATLALFPAISVLISIYGLVFDLQTVEPQLRFIRRLLPPSAYDLLVQMINNVISQTHSSLTLSLIIAIVIALWSASVGTKGLLSGLNIAYGTTESRNYFKFQFISLFMTFCGILGTITTLAVIVALPAVLRFIPKQIFEVIEIYLPTINLVSTIGNIIVLLFAAITFSLFYRYGPCRFNVFWRWIIPGSIISTLFWLLFAYGFSFYVAHIANFSSTYGPLGAVGAVLMWFWVSCYVILLGAQFNAEIERELIRKLKRKKKSKPLMQKA